MSEGLSNPFERPDEFRGPQCPEYPTFAEKLLLALALPIAENRDENPRSWVNNAAIALFKRKPPGQVCDKSGRPRTSRLKLMFLAGCAGPREIPTNVVASAEQKTWPNAPALGWAGHSFPFRDPAPPNAGDPPIPYWNLLQAAVDMGEDNPCSIAESHTPKFYNYAPYLRAVSRGETRVEEKEMLQSLCVIAKELGRWGIPMETDPVKLRLASYWDVEA